MSQRTISQKQVNGENGEKVSRCFNSTPQLSLQLVNNYSFINSKLENLLSQFDEFEFEWKYYTEGLDTSIVCIN